VWMIDTNDLSFPAVRGKQGVSRRGVRLHSVRQHGDPHPPVPRETRGHELGRLAAGIIAIEADGDEVQRRAMLEQEAICASETEEPMSLT